jgi:hypothetical protein
MSFSSLTEFNVSNIVIGLIAGFTAGSSVMSNSFTTGLLSASLISPCQKILCFTVFLNK